MIPRVSYLSAFRGSRAGSEGVHPPAVSSPVGAQDSTSAADRRKGISAQGQAQALRSDPATGPSSVWDALPNQAQAAVGAAYGAGGFDAVKQLPDWYDLPSWQRTQILAGATGRG